MSPPDAPRRALVTGAGSGIGRAVVDRLRREGWWVTGQRRPSAAGPPEDVIEVDFAVEGAVLRLAGAVAAALGGRTLDLLVHCAGEHVMGPPLAERDADRLLRVNLLVPYLLSEAVAPLMGPGATIVLLSSIAARRAQPGAELYGASKAGVEALVGSLAYRFGAAGIRVVGIAPGLVRTRMSQGVFRDDELVRDLAARHPGGRTAEPDDIADLILGAADPRMRWATGQVMSADGGNTLGHGNRVWSDDGTLRDGFLRARS
jgi:3-oxoacyl-[acyl-carrier protein] reductase